MIKVKVVIALMLRSSDTKVAVEELNAKDAKNGLENRSEDRA